jgi:hypothetical protein
VAGGPDIREWPARTALPVGAAGRAPGDFPLGQDIAPALKAVSRSSRTEGRLI